MISGALGGGEKTAQQNYTSFVILKTNNNGEYILFSQKRVQSFQTY